MLLALEGLVKRYQDHLAVDHVTLKVKEGEIMGLLGPNGAGKTTTLNMITGLTRKDNGTIRVFELDSELQGQAIKKNIGLGTAIVMITRDEILAGNIVNILVPAMTFLAEGFFRINPPTGSWLGTVQYLSPNYLAQTAFFTTIYGRDTGTILTMTAALGLVIVITLPRH
ncbi:MAG: ATP-binding cassette domain-containing protein [Bacillota bacterium]|nr:ATP-binding cassette domain-containing protein [Bacillota bacterium]MDW7677514.1 ATP-binding cassette domain-containing protein [Bacillota bacterium]